MNFRWSSLRRLPPVLALLTGFFQLPAVAAEDPVTGLWSFSLRAEGEIRYDDNILSLSEADKDRVENPAFSDGFRIESPDDFVLAPDVLLAFRRSPRRGPETGIGVTLRAYDYLRNSVKDYQSYGLWFRQELNRSRRHRTALAVGAARLPSYYLRELIDDDESLAAGMMIRNSATYAKNEGYLKISQELVNRILSVSARYALERRNYNDHFNERDSASEVGSLSLEVYPLRRNAFRIHPYYTREKRTSRSDLAPSPVLDDDVGFDSNLYGLELRWLWGPDTDHRRIITLWYENEKRDFTTDIATDTGHFEREDDITESWAGYEHELNGNWQLRFAYRYRNNDVSTPSLLGGTNTTPFTKHVGYASLVYRFGRARKTPPKGGTPTQPRPEER